VKTEETTDLHASLAMTLNSLTSSQNLGGIGMVRLASQKQAAKVQSKLTMPRVQVWVKG
jgi:hypothetical protein